MWAHYANNHKGFCIEVSIEKPNAIFLVSYVRNVDNIRKHNELLIYDDIDEVIKYYNVLGEKSQPIHKFLISNHIDIKTIEYSSCYTRLQHIYGEEIKKEDIEDLKNIGYERNAITHFGISKELDYHKLILLIHNVLKVIDRIILPKLDIDTPENKELREKIKDIKTIIYFGQMVAKAEWSKNTTGQLECIREILQSSVNNMRENGCNIEYIESEDKFGVEIGKQFYVEILEAYNVDSIFLKNENFVIAIIDFNDIEQIYIINPKKEHVYKENSRKDFWNKSKEYSKQKFNEETIIRFFTGILNDLESVKEVQ